MIINIRTLLFMLLSLSGMHVKCEADQKCTFDGMYGTCQEQACSIRRMLKRAASEDDFAKRYVNRGLVWGNHGNGKTTIALKTATEAGWESIPKAGSTMATNEGGIAVQQVTDLFQEAEDRVKNSGKPCMVIVDEVDLLHPHAQGELRSQIDSAERENKKIFVYATTNRIDRIEIALLDRLKSRSFKVHNPDSHMRRELIVGETEAMEADINNQFIDYMIKKTDGLSNRAVLIAARTMVMESDDHILTEQIIDKAVSDAAKKADEDHDTNRKTFGRQAAEAGGYVAAGITAAAGAIYIKNDETVQWVAHRFKDKVAKPAAEAVVNNVAKPAGDAAVTLLKAFFSST